MALFGAVILNLALLFQGAQPGGNIHGRVLDSEGAVIAKATIRVLDAKSRATLQTVVSDTDGRFTVDGLGAGTYVLAISYSGFNEKLVEITPPQSGGGQSLTIRLDVLDCDAPGVNCDIFSTGPYTDPHPVVVQRDLTVSAAQAIDLEKGSTVAVDSSTADARLTVQDHGLYLLPLNKAAFSLSGNDEGCGKTVKNPQPVRIDGMLPGSEFIIKTRHGRCSKLFLTQEIPAGADQASIHLVTRAK